MVEISEREISEPRSSAPVGRRNEAHQHANTTSTGPSRDRKTMTNRFLPPDHNAPDGHIQPTLGDALQEELRAAFVARDAAVVELEDLIADHRLACLERDMVLAELATLQRRCTCERAG